MEQLDLSRHGPMQCQGKFLELNGCGYVVGPQMGAGAGGTVFRLINIESRLSLHVLKIYHDQRFAHSQHEWEMHRRIHAAGLADTTAWLINIELPGGRAQVQQCIGECEPVSSPTRELFYRASDLVDNLPDWPFDSAIKLNNDEQRNLWKAADLYRAVLQINPKHTEAMRYLARGVAHLCDFNGAADLLREALTIEANHLGMWQDAVRSSALAGRSQVAHDQYKRMKEIFPYEAELKGWQ